MGVLRNSININGLIDENRLPKEVNGQTIEYSEADYIYVPQKKPKIIKLDEIGLKLEVDIGRRVNTPTGTLYMIDGIKKINIEYTCKDNYHKHTNLNFELPYNTFVDVPKGSENITDINANIIDAYFSVMDSRKIYYHLVYMINVSYPNSKVYKVT